MRAELLEALDAFFGEAGEGFESEFAFDLGEEFLAEFEDGLAHGLRHFGEFVAENKVEGSLGDEIEKFWDFLDDCLVVLLQIRIMQLNSQNMSPNQNIQFPRIHKPRVILRRHGHNFLQILQLIFLLIRLHLIQPLKLQRPRHHRHTLLMLHWFHQVRREKVQIFILEPRWIKWHLS